MPFDASSRPYTGSMTVDGNSINGYIKRLNGANRTENFVVLIYSPNMWARNHCSLLQRVVHTPTLVRAIWLLLGISILEMPRFRASPAGKFPAPLHLV